MTLWIIELRFLYSGTSVDDTGCLSPFAQACILIQESHSRIKKINILRIVGQRQIESYTALLYSHGFQDLRMVSTGRFESGHLLEMLLVIKPTRQPYRSSCVSALCYGYFIPPPIAQGFIRVDVIGSV